MKNIYLTILILSLFISNSFSQTNEFVNAGGSVTIQNGALLYVKGEVIHNGASTMDNSGTIEVNPNNATLQLGRWSWESSNQMTGTGKVIFKEVLNSEDVEIIGNNNLRFYDLDKHR
jgi:hypothetical protein